MSHIFISYSRKDLRFAQRIVDALAANELDTWIDWKSIPKGEDWEQEIYRGIEEADAFLFLLSPDSVTSEMCNKEIAHAVANGKRILPIVIRDTDVKKFQFEIAKVEISKRNWIFCREEQDDFKKAIAETRETIHTDYEWLKYHTQLQVKALAWKRTGDNSRLLRGKELREAEEQLAKFSDDEDPQPNPVQRGFVLASRRHEDAQRRRIILVLGTLVLLAIIAALVAIVQARQARANQFVAEARTAISQQNYHLAGLLALEAEHLSVGTGQDVLASLPYLGPSIGKVVKAHNGVITGLCWTADGRLVSSSDDSSLIIWDLDTGYPDISFGGGTSPYLSIAISPNGLLASGNDQGLIEIWKVDSGEKVTKFLRSSSPVLALAWSQDGWLASGSKNGRVVIWGQDGQQIAEFKEQINEITSLAWEPGGTLASASLDGSVVLWDRANTRKAITPDQTGDKVESLTWVAEDTIAIGLENGEIILWDLVESKRITILDEHLGPVNSLTVSGSGQIISGSEDGRVLIWNMDTSRPLAIFHEYIQKPVSAITTIMNGRLVSGTADGNLVIWDAETGQVMPTLKGHTESVTAVSWAEDGRLASGSKDGFVKIWRPKDWTVIQTLYGRFKSSDFIDENAILQGIYYNQGVTSIAWSKDNRLATGYSDGRVILWHQEPDMKGDLFYSHDSKIVRVTWSVEGQLATAEEDGQVIVWNIADQEPEVTFQIPKEDLPFVRLIDIAWAPDGQRIIALKEDSLAPHFFELDLQSGELRVVDFDYSSLFGYRINMIAWSEKGGMVAALNDTRRPQYDLELNMDGGMTHVNTFADDTLLWSDFPREIRP